MDGEEMDGSMVIAEVVVTLCPEGGGGGGVYLAPLFILVVYRCTLLARSVRALLKMMHTVRASRNGLYRCILYKTLHVLADRIRGTET